MKICNRINIPNVKIILFILFLLFIVSSKLSAQDDIEKKINSVEYKNKIIERAKVAAYAIALSEEQIFPLKNQYTDNYNDLINIGLKLDSMLKYSKITIYEVPNAGYFAFKFSVTDLFSNIAINFNSGAAESMQIVEYFSLE